MSPAPVQSVLPATVKLPPGESTFALAPEMFNAMLDCRLNVAEKDPPLQWTAPTPLKVLAALICPALSAGSTSQPGKRPAVG